VIKAGGKINQG